MAYEKYFKNNISLWNGKTLIHKDTAFYDMEGFKKGKTSLDEIEIKGLGDVKGKSVLHLQCHFGLSTLSIARMGANVVGVDFSDEAIKTARQLNDEVGMDAEFICSNVYDLKKNMQRDYVRHINEKDKTHSFDIIFTSYGVVGWLPDLDKWADIISHFLKPGGTFFMAEFHFVPWMFDDKMKKVKYSYFKQDYPIDEIVHGTYADPGSDFEHRTFEWTHSLSEVFNALWKKGFKITEFEEYDFSTANCFPNTVVVSKGKWMISGMEGLMPLMFHIKAIKKST